MKLGKVRILFAMLFIYLGDRERSSRFTRQVLAPRMIDKKKQWLTSSLTIILTFSVMLRSTLAECENSTVNASDIKGAEQYVISIPSLSVAKALTHLAEKTSALFLFPYDIAESRHANPVKGKYTVLDALDKILQGSGLATDLSEKGVIRIYVDDNANQNNQERESMNTKKKILSSVVALLVVSGGGVDAQTENVGAQSGELLEEVNVTARYRKAMAKSIELKRMEMGFSDSLVATDVANFPEQNLVEALQRMPGISMTRDRGIGTGVSVRSLPGEFTHVTVNNLATSAGGEGRGVPLDIFATDAVQNVTVKKSPTAADQEGGVAGTIEIQTARPFDYTEDRLIVNTEAAYNSISEETDPKFSFLGSKQFGDWGVLFSYTGNTRSNRTDGNGDNGWGLRTSKDMLNGGDSAAYIAALADYGYTFDDPANITETEKISLAFPRYANRSFYLDDQDKWGSTLSLQYKPSDTFELTLDGMVGGFESISDQYSSAIWMPVGGSYPEEIHNIDTTTLAAEGIAVITDATFTNHQFEMNVRRNRSDTEYKQLSLALDWQVAGWDIDGLIGYSGSTQEKEAIQTLYLAYERARTYYTPTGFATVQAAPSVDDPNPWDPAAESSVTDYEFYRYDKGLWDIQDNKYAAQLDFQSDFDIDWFSLQFGVRYTDKEKVRNFGNIQIKGPGEGDDSWRWNRTLAPSEVSKVSDIIGGAAPKIPGNDWWAIPAGDAEGLFAYDGYLNDWEKNQYWEVREKTSSFYVMTDFSFEVAEMPVHLNTGVRVVDNQVTGYGFAPSLTEIDAYEATPSSIDGSSTDVLPSLNVTVDLTDDLVFRAAGSKTIIRPALDQLAPRRSVNRGAREIYDGNPSLKSTESEQWELGFEWYLPKGGLLAFSYFDKQIGGALEQVQTGTLDNVEVFDPITNGSSNVTFDIYQKVNAAEVYDISGYEFNVQLPLGDYYEPLAGFGVDANYTILDTSKTTDSDLVFVPSAPQGFVDDTFNATVYYENDTFDVRVSYNFKSDHFTTISDNVYPVFRAAYGQYDLSTGYNVTDDIKVTLKVINLTDESAESYIMDSAFNTGYEYSGRRISLGLRADF